MPQKHRTVCACIEAGLQDCPCLYAMPSRALCGCCHVFLDSIIESCAFTLDSAALYKAAIIPEQQRSWGGLGLKGALNEGHLILMKLTGCTLFVFSFLKCPGLTERLEQTTACLLTIRGLNLTRRTQAEYFHGSSNCHYFIIYIADRP